GGVLGGGGDTCHWITCAAGGCLPRGHGTNYSAGVVIAEDLPGWRAFPRPNQRACLAQADTVAEPRARQTPSILSRCDREARAGQGLQAQAGAHDLAEDRSGNFDGVPASGGRQADAARATGSVAADDLDVAQAPAELRAAVGVQRALEVVPRERHAPSAMRCDIVRSRDE